MQLVRALVTQIASYKLWFSETHGFQLAMFDSIGLYVTKTTFLINCTVSLSPKIFSKFVY